jgi:hypothetical protein
MILPVGRGWQEGIPSPKYSLIVASGHSPLSFASGRWSPQLSILGTRSLHWLATGWSHDPSHTSTSHHSHGLDSRRSRSGLQRWAQSARRGRPPNRAALADPMGLYKLTQSSRDNQSQEIFVVGLGISLCLIPSASMAPANARGTQQSTKLQRLRREMTVRSRGPQSPRRVHAIRWHGPAVFDNLYH